jgi:hypothetical protein
VNKQEKVDHAFDLYQEILDTIPEETLRVFKLGHLFKRIRDEKLFKCLDSCCDNFEQFCADPEIGYARSTIYSYIKIWEVFIEELHLNMDTLRHIRYKRLQLILPHVSKDPDEWLSRAKALSPKDLINAIRKEKGRQPMKEVVKKKALHGGYIEYAKAYGCIHHRNRKPEMAHFPQTDKMGGTHVVPLCHRCHIGELHTIGVDSYFSLYKNQICDYLFNLIYDLYKELATK